MYYLLSFSAKIKGIHTDAEWDEAGGMDDLVLLVQEALRVELAGVLPVLGGRVHAVAVDEDPGTYTRGKEQFVNYQYTEGKRAVCKLSVEKGAVCKISVNKRSSV